MATSPSQADVDEAKVRAAENATDVELGDPFHRVRNLVQIKENSYFRVAQEDWKQQKKSLGAKVDRREKRVEELTNQIYNLVGFYSVFQGVILTAVTQLTQSTQAAPAAQAGAPNCPVCPSCPPRVLCGKAWFPVVLSGLAAIAAVVGIGVKFSHLYSIEKLIHLEKLQLREAERREARLQETGAKFKFKYLLKDPPGRAGRVARRYPIVRKFKSYLIHKAVAVNGVVVAFTVIFISSYFVILCDKWIIKEWY